MLPVIDDRKALAASRGLAGAGALVALAAAVVDATAAEAFSPALLAVAMLLVGLAAFALGARPPEGGERPARTLAGGLDARFRRNVRLAAYTLGMYGVFVLLAVVGAASVLAAFGVFGAFELGADLAGRHLEILLALATAALAGATPFAAHVPVQTALPSHRVRGSVVAAGVILSGVLAANASAFLTAVPDGVGAISFLAAAVALVFVVRWNARLPDLAHVLEWLETDDHVRKSDLPRAVVFGMSAVAGASALAAIAAGAGLASPAFGDAMLAVALFAVVLASFGVGITPVASMFEYGRADLEAARRRRVGILRALTYGLAGVAGIVGALATLTVLGTAAGVAAFVSVSGGFVSARGAWLGLAILPLVGTLVARVFVKSDREYTEEARALSSLLAAGVVVLLSMGALMGTGAVSGSWVSGTSAALLLSASVILLTFFVRTRALLPPILDLARFSSSNKEEIRDAEDLKEAIQRRMIWTYVLSGLFLVGFVGFLFASSFGAFEISPTGPGRDAVFLGWLLGGLALLAVVAVRYFQSSKIETKLVHTEEDIGTRRLTPEEFQRYLILGVSAALALLFVVLGVLTFAGKLTSLGPVALDPRYGTDFFVFAILVGLGPYGFYHNRELKRIAAIDAKFPEFLRDLAESQRSGMTLTEAVITASKGTYGALTWEIRKMAAQIEWGVSFTDALQRFAKRVRTPLIERTVSLIVEASNAGGNVVDVLTAAADDSREIQLILKERKSAMSIYTMIIYIAFLVFIGVIAILNAQFIPEVAKAVKGAEGVSIGGLTFRSFDENEFKMLFFHGAVIQGFGGGLVAGVMEGGKPVAGLKHAFIMVSLAYVLFRFVIGG